mgnify:CR=1 FL=1
MENNVILCYTLFKGALYCCQQIDEFHWRCGKCHRGRCELNQRWCYACDCALIWEKRFILDLYAGKHLVKMTFDPVSFQMGLTSGDMSSCIQFAD